MTNVRAITYGSMANIASGYLSIGIKGEQAASELGASIEESGLFSYGGDVDVEAGDEELNVGFSCRWNGDDCWNWIDAQLSESSILSDTCKEALRNAQIAGYTYEYGCQHRDRVHKRAGESKLKREVASIPDNIVCALKIADAFSLEPEKTMTVSGGTVTLLSKSQSEENGDESVYSFSIACGYSMELILSVNESTLSSEEPRYRIVEIELEGWDSEDDDEDYNETDMFKEILDDIVANFDSIYEKQQAAQDGRTHLFYRCQEDGRVDILFAYNQVTPSSYAWCVKGVSSLGSTTQTSGFGLLRINSNSGHIECYIFEEIDYQNTCTSELYRYSCEGTSIAQIRFDEEAELEELDELLVSDEEMRGLSECETLLDDYCYTAEEDQNSSCGCFIDKEKWRQHGDTFETESFDGRMHNAIISSCALKVAKKMTEPPVILGKSLVTNCLELVIENALTESIGLLPGDEFQILVEGKVMRLIPCESDDENPGCLIVEVDGEGRLTLFSAAISAMGCRAGEELGISFCPTGIVVSSLQ